MFTLVSIFALFTISLAVPQYPPSGWRPKGTPFVLPREYLPSSPLKSAAQFEINRERLEYLGQYQVREPFFGFGSNSGFEQPQQQQQQHKFQNQIQSQPQPQPQPQPESQIQVQVQSDSQERRPHTTYLAARSDIPTTTEQSFDDTTIFSTTTEYPTTTEIFTTTENFLKVQGLPLVGQPAQFRDGNVKVVPLNQRKNGQLRQQANLQQQQQQQQQPKAQISFVNNEQNKFGKQVVEPTITNTYGEPQASPSPNTLTPDNEYGPPQDNITPEKEDVDTLKSENENNEDSDDEENDSEQANIAISNSVNTNGQYYILSPDNMLQRVIFMTTPNQKDSGFTAQLRYMPVEPIRDPVYAYNQQGQLVRIFRK